ncbi:MAG: ATP-binding cassette domain-containing protein [Bacteroidales bacterium]
MYVLETKNIVKNYANHCALDNVSIQVSQGSIFGLLGPNGAGKTSLIRIINQITAPDKGDVFIGGEKLNAKHIYQIGYLPEERGLYKKMKVGEQALYLAQLKGLSKADAAKRLKYWFEKFEIQAWWDKKVEELSKGMQQKIQFVVTILHEPKLLIFDEPFSGFDPINTQMLKDEILNLKEKGSTVIFSTHNMASVEEICDEIALINKSHKVLDGKMSDIKKSHKANTYELVFKSEIPLETLLSSPIELLEEKTLFQDHLRSVRFKLLSNTNTNDLLQQVMQGAEIKEFREILPSMNDIFIQTVKQENHE